MTVKIMILGLGNIAIWQVVKIAVYGCNSSYRELFWESHFGRAVLERQFKELPWKFIIPWIPQIRLPTDTQQTPNNAPKRIQRGLNLDTSFEDLNWIPHVERSFEELMVITIYGSRICNHKKWKIKVFKKVDIKVHGL